MCQEAAATVLMPGAFGAYSQAVKAGNYVFLSGQLGVDQLGLTMSDVAKTTVFLRDIADIDRMNSVYAEAFGAHRPARSTVQIVALNKEASVEIEAIAYLGNEE